MPITGGKAQRTKPIGSPSLEIQEAVRRALEDLGSTNFREGALGYGKPENGARAGAHNNAVWATIRLTGAGRYEVPHNLRAVPILCELKRTIPPTGASPWPHISSSPVDLHLWTETIAVVDIAVLVGSASEVVAEFLVRGE